LTAQAPAPAQPSGKPIRHLEYAFTVDEEGVSEYHYNGIGNGVETGAGVGGGAVSDGGQGTMSIDVMSLTSDGALQVRISEFVQNEPRPRAAYTCTVYGNTTVLCPSVPAPSDAEWVLLSYLGRQFVDAAPWDPAHHWQRATNTAQYALTEDFTMADPTDATVAVIRETKKMQMHNGDFGTRVDDVRITYDRSMEIPKAVHDDIQETGTGGSSHASFDFRLTADSFVKPSNG
jgi:hypothetical protein